MGRGGRTPDQALGITEARAVVRGRVDPHGREAGRTKWTDEVIERTLRDLAGGSGQFPGHLQFRAAGVHGLYQKLYLDGTREQWAQKLGLTLSKQRWTDERIEETLKRIAGDSRAFPTHAELVAAGAEALYQKLAHDGTLQDWAEQLGLSREDTPYVSWSDERMEQALRELAGDSGVFPTVQQMRKAGLERVYRRLLDAGDRREWAKRLGLRLA